MGTPRRTAVVLLLILAASAPGCSRGTTDAASPPNAAKPLAKDSAQPVSASRPTPAEERLVDLTHPFDETTIYWPTEAGFRLEKGPAGITERGYYYSANRFAAAEHGGTHIDAPIHFYDDRDTVDAIPLTRLVGDAVVVDVTRKCAADRDYQVQIEDLRAWEEEHRLALGGKIVLLRTGFSDFWPDREKYLGTAETGLRGVNELRFPGLDSVAARWLVEQRNVKAVGIDTASIDHGQSKEFGSHVQLCRHNVPIFENVAQLDALPDHGFRIVALPMKIAGGSGGPLRIVALVPR